jgi:hypothetical protein
VKTVAEFNFRARSSAELGRTVSGRERQNFVKEEAIEAGYTAGFAATAATYCRFSAEEEITFISCQS